MDTYYRVDEDSIEWNQGYMPEENTGMYDENIYQEEDYYNRRREQARKKRQRMLRQKQRKRRRIKRLIRAGIRLGTMTVILIAGFSFLAKGITGLIKKEGIIAQPYYHETTELSVEQVQKKDVYKYVLENPELYPAGMAEKLENNPELLDFVEHYPEYEPVARGGINKWEKKEKCPLFIQWDERWGYAAYGDDNIGFSGCGPACLSMVIYSLTRDENVTPDVIGQFAMEQGYYVYGTGTSWELMTAAAGAYGINVSILGLDRQIMKDSLDCGHLLIASMGPGDFTTSGHFIVIYGYNDEGFFVNDPNSKKRSNEVWNFETLRSQIRNLWVYYK